MADSVGRLLFGLTHRLRRSDALRLLRSIASEPFLPPEEAARRQLARLRALLSHCERHVPYYRQVFRELGMHADDVRSLNDFAALPVLTKDIVRERERDLLRDDVPIEALSPHFSGGSTGIPLRFYRDRHYMAISEAGTYRNLLQCGWRPGEMIGHFWGFNDRLAGMSRLEFELRQRLRRSWQFDSFRSGADDMDRWMGTLRRVRPTVALGYASTLARFAEHLELRGSAPVHLKGVFTTAEKLFPAQREALERAFGCKVYDCYGSSEVQNIAAECPAGNMHVSSDFVVLEEDAAAEREPAALLVTSLQNRAMPFLRYRNEDCGRLLRGVCGCGRGFPLMDLQVGRISDNFRLPGGRVVHGEFMTHLLYGSDGIDRFQFVQVAPDRIRLDVVPDNGHSQRRAVALSQAVERLQALAPGLRVDVREVAEIPLSSAGKHRFTRSEVHSPKGAD